MRISASLRAWPRSRAKPIVCVSPSTCRHPRYRAIVRLLRASSNALHSRHIRHRAARLRSRAWQVQWTAPHRTSLRSFWDGEHHQGRKRQTPPSRRRRNEQLPPSILSGLASVRTLVGLAALVLEHCYSVFDVKWPRAAGPFMAAVKLEGRLLVVLYQAANGSFCCGF